MPMTDGQDLFEPLVAPEKPKRTRKKKDKVEEAGKITVEQVEEALAPEFRKYIPPEKMQMIFEALVDACQATKTIYSPRGYKCQKCGCPHVHSFEVTDTATFLKAADLLFDRVYGRPGTSAGEDAGIVVKRIVVGVDE